MLIYIHIYEQKRSFLKMFSLTFIAHVSVQSMWHAFNATNTDEFPPEFGYFNLLGRSRPKTSIINYRTKWGEIGDTESKFPRCVIILWMKASLQSIKGTVLQITVGFGARIVQTIFQHVYILFNSYFSFYRISVF